MKKPYSLGVSYGWLYVSKGKNNRVTKLRRKE